MTHCECGQTLKPTDTFCQWCGMKLARVIKQQIFDDVKEALLETHHAHSATTPPLESDGGLSADDSAVLPGADDDPREAEFRRVLREVFADGVVTSEEIVALSNRVKQLGLDRGTARKIQEDVAREMGYDVDDEGDLISSGIVLEVNTKKSYFIDEMDDIEFRLTNVSEESIDSTLLAGNFLNLRSREDKPVGALRPLQRRSAALPFCHSRRGNEVVEVTIEYTDARGNPSIYSSEFRMKVFGREMERTATESISISIAAEKIMGNDFSDLARIMAQERPKEAEGKEGKSSYEDYEKRWIRLPVFFDENSTNARRNDIVIAKRLKEGERKLEEAKEVRQSSQRMMIPSVSREALKNAYDLLKEAEEAFRKIRELDPDNPASLRGFRESLAILGELEQEIDGLDRQPKPATLQTTAGCLVIRSLEKRVCLYSKDRITMGRESSNDIVLRLMPYQPKESYPDNWQRSAMISSVHSEIVNRSGQFFIRDIGSANAGSTNGTYVEGKKLAPLTDVPLQDDARINVGKVLDLECHFFGEAKADSQGAQNLTGCFTVFGDVADSCFGIDKSSPVNAIKFKRKNNYNDRESYLILIRETTLGRSKNNGISLDVDGISDIHARLFYRDGQYWIEDMNSRTGTRVNGRPCGQGDEIPLGRTAEILLGNVQIQFVGYA